MVCIFTDGIFKCIYAKENVYTLMYIPLNFFTQDFNFQYASIIALMTTDRHLLVTNISNAI